MFLTSALLCLASNLFFESRGEPLVGQIAVANVTLNRAQYRPDQVCAVVLKRKQFSWTVTRVRATERGAWVNKKHLRKEPEAWGRSLVLAQLALWGLLPRVVGGATHFHAQNVRPYWASHYTVVATHGGHIFYK